MYEVMLVLTPNHENINYNNCEVRLLNHLFGKSEKVLKILENTFQYVHCPAKWDKRLPVFEIRKKKFYLR